MAEKDLRLNISTIGTDKSVRDVNKFNKSLKNTDSTNKDLDKSFKILKVAVTGFLAAFTVTKITSFINESIKLANAQENAEKALKSSMVTAGKYSDAFFNASKKIASGFQQTTVYGDEATLSAMRWLQNVKEIGDDKSLKIATKAMLDYASFTNKSLEEAGKTVSSFLNNNTRGLRELGISLSKSELEHMSWADKIILLNSKVAGSAEAMADTYEGQLIRLSNAWGDFREKIGEYFKSVIKDYGILDKLNKVIKFLSDNVESLVKVFKLLVEVIGIVFISKIGLYISGMFNAAAVTTTLTTSTTGLTTATIADAEARLYQTWLTKSGTNEYYMQAAALENLKLSLQGVTGAATTAGGAASGAATSFGLLSKAIAAVVGYNIGKWIGDWLSGIEKVQDAIDYIIASQQLMSEGVYTPKRFEEILAEIKGLADIPESIKKEQERLNRIYDITKTIQEKIKKESTDKYEYERSFIEKELKDNIELGVGKLKATKLYNLQIKELDQKYADEKFKINSELYDKIKELQSTDYEWSRYLIEKELKDHLKSGVDKLKAIELYYLQVQALDKKYAEKPYDIAALTSARKMHTTAIAESFKESWKEAESMFERYQAGWNFRINEFIDKYKIIPDEVEDVVDNIYILWNDLAEGITDSFTDAFKEILRGGKLDFEELGESIKDVFADVIADIAKKEFISPFINQMVSEMSGRQIGQAFPSTFVGPLPQGGQQATPWMGAGMAGMAGYGLTGSKIGGIGGAAGFAVAGPMGAVAGTMIGTVVEGLIDSIKKEKPKLPSISIFYEVVDGKIKEISEDWKNVTRDPKVIQSIRESLQAQLDVYKDVAQMFGESISDWAGGGIGTNIQAITGYTSPLHGIIANIDLFQQVGGTEFTKQLEELFIQVFQDFTNKMLQSKKPWYYAEPTEDVIKRLMEITDPTVRMEEFNKWLTSKQYTAMGDFTRWGIPAEFIDEGDLAALDKFFETFKEKSQTIKDFFSPALSDALMTIFEDGTFQQFGDKLRVGIADQIKNAILQGFISRELMPLITQAFEEQYYLTRGGYETKRPSLVDVLTKYISGEMPLAEVEKNITLMGTDLTEMISKTTPFLESLVSVLNNVDEALDVNSAAIRLNTDAIRGPVEDFINQLTFGEFAPVQSAAKLAQTQQELFGKAVEDYNKFSEYASFMTQYNLPYLQTISGDLETTTGEKNYQDIINQIKEEVTNIPWFIEAGGEPYTPEDNAKAIAKELAPMFKEIAENEDVEVNVYIGNEKINDIIYQVIKGSRDIKKFIKNI